MHEDDVTLESLPLAGPGEIIFDGSCKCTYEYHTGLDQLRWYLVAHRDEHRGREARWASM